MPIHMTSSLQGDDGYNFLYYSTNAIGVTEHPNRADISFDFTKPQSEITATYGDDDPIAVDGVLVFDTDSLTIAATDNLSGVARIDYRYGSGSAYASVAGPNATLEFPCFFLTDYTLSWRAADVAGNEENWHTQDIQVPSCSDYLEIRDRLSDLLDAEAGRAMFNQPPRAVDGRVGLGFRVPGNVGDPDKVVFQYSGPFNADYQGHVWHNIAEAQFNNKTNLWETGWDTVNAGIGNAFYWVRSVPEFTGKKGATKADNDLTAPHLLWINNLDRQNGQEDHLLVSSLFDTVKPGDTFTVSVAHNVGGQSDLTNATIRLMVDEDMYLDLKEENVVKTVANWKAQDDVDFTLTLKNENLPDAGKLAFKAAVKADGVPLLTSDYLSLTLERRPIAIKGLVQDVDGKSVEATLELSIPPYMPVTAQTDKNGRYSFTGIPANPQTYLLAITDIDGDYRVILPREGTCDIRSDGDDVTVDFLLAGDDDQAPVFSNIDSFDEAANNGTLTGLICDGNFGSGVVALTLTVKDEAAGLYLDANGGWHDTETSIPVLDIDDCESSRPVSDIGFEPVQGNLTPDTRCVTFSQTLPLTADLDFGRKTVTLEAEDDAGNVSSIRLRRSRIKAAFEADKASGTAPLTVNFTNQSQGSVDFSNWDFGDGETSPDHSPSHTFEKPGVYTVSLNIAGMETSDAVEKAALITVGEGNSGGGGGCFIRSLF
jgi:plastocyanin